VTATSSLAATTGGLTVSPGGPFTATSGTVTVVVSSTGSKLTCTSSKATGVFKKGSGLSGTHIGRFKTFTFSKCTGPDGLSFTITPTLPWYINITSINMAQGVADGTISSISATVSAPGCSFVVAGTSASEGGTTGITYTNSTAHLDVTEANSTLHIWDVSGCFGLVADGDTISYSADYTVNPPQTIT
jgi:hypothetical protein